MSDRIGGWGQPGLSPAGAPQQVTKPALTGKQHIVYALTITWSGTPGSPVLCQLVNPDVSPNAILWQGHVSTQATHFSFPAGICSPVGSEVALVIPGSGALVSAGTIHGATR